MHALPGNSRLRRVVCACGGLSSAPDRAAGYPDSATVGAGVIRAHRALCGRGRCLDGVGAARRLGGVRSGLPGPPPLRNWNARCLTVAARRTPHPAQAPHAVVRSNSVWRRERLRSTRGSGRKPSERRAPGAHGSRGAGKPSRAIWPRRAARRPCCGAPRAARLRRRAYSFARAAGRSIRGRKAAPLHRADTAIRKPLARMDRRRPKPARRRAARSRGAPQRGGRAGDSHTDGTTTSDLATSVRSPRPRRRSAPAAEPRGAAWKEGAPAARSARWQRDHTVT
jgi:hypothetical protein